MRSRSSWVVVALVALVCGVAGSSAQARDTAAESKDFAGPGRYSVETIRLDWTDDARKREVPVKIYFPKTGDGPFPVIVFSHGLGGSREGCQYLGRQWASHGYISVHVQHRGSDSDVWKGQANPMKALLDAVKDPMNAIHRPSDIKFAIDRLEKLNREEGPLRGRLDLARLGAAGYSFGAFTTLAVAGEVFALPAGRKIRVADGRIKAAIAMSAPVPHRQGQLDEAFGSITIPCLHMTGTEDDSPIGETRKEDRRLPFDHSKGAGQYLITFAGGDHGIFSGHARRFGQGRKDARFQELIRASSTAFWDAYLKDDTAARRWLAEGGFDRMMGDDGALEKRSKATPAAATQ